MATAKNRPTREDILRATTKEELAEITERLLEWQRDLDLRDGFEEEEEERVEPSQPQPTAAAEKGKGKDMVAEDDLLTEEGHDADGFEMLMGTSSTDSVASSQPSASIATASKVVPKTPFTCSEVGCMRLVMRPELNLHRCSVCKRVFCSVHSDRLTISINQLRSPAEVTAVCDVCAEVTRWSPGITRDRSAEFIRVRERFSTAAAEENASWKSSVADCIGTMFLDAPQGIPAVAQQAPEAIAGVFRSIVLTASQTWQSCAQCGKYFERLSIKRSCSICRLDFCASCGVTQLQLDGALASAVIGMQIPSQRLPIACSCCSKCVRLLKRESIAMKMSTGKGRSPDWSKRYYDAVELSRGIASAIDVLREEGDSLFAEGESPAVKSVTAMVAELQDATLWFATAQASCQPGAQQRLLRGVRKRLLEDVHSRKDGLLRLRAMSLSKQPKQ